MRKRNVVAAVFAVTCITATGAIASARTGKQHTVIFVQQAWREARLKNYI